MLPPIGFLLRHSLRLFDFRRPRIRELNCLELVLDNKRLLLVGWDAVPATGIRIRPGGARFRLSSGAAICKLPAGTTTVDILVQNVWRSKKERLSLKQLSVDETVLNFFDRNYTEGIQFAGINKLRSKMPDIQVEYISINIPMTVKPSSYSLSFHRPLFNDYAP